jgi:hypothetical protein
MLTTSFLPASSLREEAGRRYDAPVRGRLTASLPLSMPAEDERPAVPSGTGARRRTQLDLGWCAGSTVQPRKQRLIEGVGTASLVSLQAQLYAAQEASQGATGGGARDDGAAVVTTTRIRTVPATRDRALGLGSNPGVADRSARDEAAAAAASDVQGNLERKAALYDHLARGGVTDPNDERYEVDFLTKAPPPMTAAELAEEQRREEQRAAIQALAHETAAGRTQAAAAKDARQASTAAQRDALRAAFVAKIKSRAQDKTG